MSRINLYIEKAQLFQRKPIVYIIPLMADPPKPLEREIKAITFEEDKFSVTTQEGDYLTSDGYFYTEQTFWKKIKNVRFLWCTNCALVKRIYKAYSEWSWGKTREF